MSDSNSVPCVEVTVEDLGGASVYLKVIKETSQAYITNVQPRLGLIGETSNDKIKGIIRWSKNNAKIKVTKIPENELSSFNVYT